MVEPQPFSCFPVSITSHICHMGPATRSAGGVTTLPSGKAFNSMAHSELEKTRFKYSLDTHPFGCLELTASCQPLMRTLTVLHGACRNISIAIRMKVALGGCCQLLCQTSRSMQNDKSKFANLRQQHVASDRLTTAQQQ